MVVLNTGAWRSRLRAPFVRVSPTARRSGSMEPAFRRGDILFLNNQDNPIRVGEVVVFKIKDRDIPIVHRVIKVHEKESGEVDLVKVVADTADPHFWTACRTSYFHASPSLYAALPACHFRRLYSFCLADDDA